MLLRTIRWLLGYVVFEVKGGHPEKFINLTTQKEINLWDIQKQNGDLTSKVIAAEYKNLRHSAKKSNSRIKMKKKHGLPFFFLKHKKRSGVLVGAALFLCALYIFSMYVWSINISGNENIPTEEIVKVMHELGVSPGSLKSRINARMVQQQAMIKLTDTAWMSVNIVGSHVDVAIKEKAETPDIIAQGAPCNIIAVADGQIERMETYKGTAAVTTNDVVLQGQLLISGVVESTLGENTFVHADGKVFAKTRRQLVEKIKLSQLKCEDTGKTIKRYRFKIFGLEIPFNLWHQIDDNYRNEFSSFTPQVGSVHLPITIFKEEWHEQACGEIFLTNEEAFTEAQKALEVREQTELEGIKTLDKYVENKEENEEFILEATYICVEDIGKKEEILFN